MANETSYPNYSVYVLKGGQLLIPGSSRQRKKIYEYQKAVDYAQALYRRYNRRAQTVQEQYSPGKPFIEDSFVILEYSGPYTSRIKAVISDQGVDRFSSTNPES